MDQRLSRLVTDKPVVIFSRTTCCMSYTIKSLICSFGANPMVYELDEMPNGGEIEQALQQMGCNPSVPAVFIGQKLIGGANQIMSLQVKDKLGASLRKAGAIWV